MSQPDDSAKVASKISKQLLLIPALIVLPYISSCGGGMHSVAQPSSPGEGRGRGTPAVEVAIARSQTLEEPIEYTGNTQPVREVSLRSQAEGRLLNLSVDVGDPVTQGEILGRLDDALLMSSLSEAEAELAARESDIARAQTQVRSAQVRAEQAQAELRQAQVEAARFTNLVEAGVLARQEAEVAQTAATLAAKTLRSAEEQIRNEQQAVIAAQQRVRAQRSAIAQIRERRSHTILTSPITGVVVERITEPGNLVQPGGEVLRIADFSQVRVIVPVSELDLDEVRVGQSVTVRLDSLRNQELTGTVTRISPAADAEARQVPVEVTIPNPNRRIGSGLLARVLFSASNAERVVIPQAALDISEEDAVYVLSGEGENAQVQKRFVQLGEQRSGRVEVLSGLQAGERFVVRSGSPLEDGATVRLSMLSD